MQNKIILLSLSILMAFQSKAQIGGLHVFKFLELSNSARETALAENLISVLDHDVALTYANPALSNELMHQQIFFSNNFHFTGIEHGYASYGHSLNKFDINLHAGLKYVQYGDFTRTDLIGNKTGQFKANELAFVMGGAKAINERMRVGLNLKFIYSRMESYLSTGLASDLGFHYNNPDKLFTASLLIRNLGTQLSTYNGTRESLPVDLQAGISKRLEHLPFRFSVTAQQLNRWNLLYDDPNDEQSSIFFEEPDEPGIISLFADNLFRHLIFNGEFLLGKKENFRLRIGYNHLRRQELRVANFRGMGGFSGGVGLKINRFRIDYGFGTWHLAGSSHHLSLSTSIPEFRKKI